MKSKLNLSTRFAVFTAMLLIVFSVAAAAQSIVSGDVNGIVTDPSGAVVSGAQVTIKNVDTGTTQTATTNQSGFYRFAFLKPGRYELTINQSGFSPVTRPVQVAVGQATRSDFRLALGAQTQTVEVSADTPLVQTDNGNVQTSFNTAQIESLPNPGGDITYVATQAPGVAINASSGGGYGNFTANGLPATSNLFTVNGNDNMDPYLNLNNSGASNLTLGANELAEATVTTNGYTGEFGRNAGAQVNYATKSGTNNFHGNVLYDWTGAALMARDWFANAGGYQPNPNAQAHQWGASFGGPIWRNKTFFFVNAEGIKYKLPTSQSVNIPSQAYMTGVLTGDPAFYSALCSYQETQGMLDPGTCASGNPYTPIAASAIPFYTKMFNLYKNAPGASGAVPLAGSPYISTFRSLATNTAHEWILSGRVDHEFTAADKVFFRYKTDHGIQPTYTDPISPVFNAESVQPSYEGQANWSHMFGSSVVNQFVLSGMYYSAIFRPVNQQAAIAAFPYSLGFNSDFAALGGENYAFPQGRNVGQGQVVDDLSITAGKHTFKTGINYRYDKITDYVYSTRSVFPLAGEQDIGNFASGIWDVYQQRFPSRNSQPFTMFSMGIYGQDTWKVSNSLTVTLALRGDHNANPHCLTNCFARLAVPYGDLAHDVTVPYNTAIQNGVPNAFRSIDAVAWQPRFGFAWTLPGLSSAALRGGFGIFSDLFPGTLAQPLSRNLPQVASFTIFGGDVDPGSANSAQAQAAAANAVFRQQFGTGGTQASIKTALANLPTPVGFSAPSLNDVPNQLHNPTFYKWNLAWEQAIGSKMSFSVNYNGNHGKDIFVYNYPSAFSAATASRPNGVPGFPTASPDPRFLTITQLTNGGTSNYHGLTTSFLRRYSQLQWQVAYTWSHSLDDVSNGGVLPYSGNDSLLGQINPSCLHCQNYGNSDYDIRHYFQASYNWTPGWKFENGFLNNAFGGWILGQTFMFRTGLPFSVYNSTTSTSTVRGYGGQILAGVLGGYSTCGAPTVADPTTQQACLDPTAFRSASATGVGPLANQRRNQFRGPGYFDSDVTLTKNFKLTEQVRLGVGATAFNVFNHPNFGNPVNDIASSDFGKVLNTVAPPTSPFGAFAGVSSGRIVQLQARFTF